MDVSSQFPKLSEVLVQGRPPKHSAFLILLTQEFGVSVDEKGKRALKLRLDANLPVLLTTKQKHLFQAMCAEDRRAAEFVKSLDRPGEHVYRGPFPFRWASAGCLPVFVIGGVRYVMLFLRDLQPTVGWNVANGASNTMDELWRVEDLAERESKEEILVLHRTEKEEVWRRLEMPGGHIQQLDSHRRVLRALGRTPRIEMNPVVGRIDYDAPDHVEVTATWAVKQTPAVTNKGFVIFNTENGENGIEFIQLLEWEIKDGDRDVRVHDLVFFDAELSEDCDLDEGKSRGEPILQAVGLFPVEELIPEFLKAEPQPKPKYVYDRGVLFSGEDLTAWLKKHPYASHWCPVARKALRRYFDHAFGQNAMVRNPDGSWTLTFAGHSQRLKHRLGLGYLAHLLRNAGEFVPCEALARMANPPEPGGAVTQDDEQHLRALGLMSDGSHSNQPAFDRTALNAIRSREFELCAKIEAWNSQLEAAEAQSNFSEAGRIEALLHAAREECDQLAEQLERNSGLGGRLRDINHSNLSNARLAVKKAIDRTIELLGKENKKLETHFKEFLHTGSSCHYSPPAGTPWFVSPP